MAWMIVGILFLVPIYDAARSKGRNPTGYVGAAAVLAFAAWACALFADLGLSPEGPLPALGGAFMLALPAAVLFIVLLLKPLKGAPGEAYLKITFPCPRCGAINTFDREREGFADLCPQCGELVTVPTDRHSPQPEPPARREPGATEGEVCLERYGRKEVADLTQVILADNGIPARVAGDDGGGTLPMAALGGYRVLIDRNDWDRAVAILQEIRTEPPDDPKDPGPPDAAGQSPPGAAESAPMNNRRIYP